MLNNTSFTSTACSIILLSPSPHVPPPRSPPHHHHPIHTPLCFVFKSSRNMLSHVSLEYNSSIISCLELSLNQTTQPIDESSPPNSTQSDQSSQPNQTNKTNQVNQTQPNQTVTASDQFQLAVIVLTNFLWQLATGVVSPLLPSYAESLGCR